MLHPMKQETGDIIGERLEKINKYLHKSGGQFKPESIHSFRLEVKKLRSFLKMIALSGNTVSIPKRLKKLYRILGRIRLIQLQRQAILKTTAKAHTGTPSHYTASLVTEKYSLKKNAKKYIHTMPPLKTKDFGRDLPDKIVAADSWKFFALQENRLADIFRLANPDEKTLHEARKILKIIIYDLPYMKDRSIRSRELNRTRTAQMKALESKIGEFHDISTCIRFLGQALKDSYGIREKNSLSLILNQWEKDNGEVKKQITDMSITLLYKDTKLA
jgi:CHAD domain-containing protein